jgi:hypothetical protein
MTAKFRLYFKTEALRKRFEPLLREIPDYFEFEIITGTPEIQILSDTDPMWIGFPYPVNSGDVYVFDDDIPAHAAGGGSEMRAAVRVMDHDPDDVILLRLWHELLHAVGQPVDDMSRMTDEWQTWPDMIVWWIWTRLGCSVDCPYWQRKFYRYLTARAAAGEAQERDV